MRELRPEMYPQLYSAESGDPFLTLIVIDHPSFSQKIRLVNNTEDIVSNGETYMAFPMTIVLPLDDGESIREMSIDFDNTGLELITPLRSVTTPLDVEISMVLASNPDMVQIEIGELKLKDVTYNASSINSKLYMDDFLDTEVASEKYSPTLFPGLF